MKDKISLFFHFKLVFTPASADILVTFFKSTSRKGGSSVSVTARGTENEGNERSRDRRSKMMKDANLLFFSDAKYIIGNFMVQPHAEKLRGKEVKFSLEGRHK